MSYAIDIYTLEGIKKESLTLDALFADDQINEWLIHEYVVMYLANQRQNTAKVKTRGEVTRSGKKLFKQKGTGRARVGDAGSPIRRKGWVAFWPNPLTNWTKKMNQKMRQKALLWALVLQLKDANVQGVVDMSFSTPKTKEASASLKALSLHATKTLIVLDTHNDVVYKSYRNIAGVSVTTLWLVNPYDLLTHKKVLITKQAIANLSTRFHLLTQSA